MKRHPSLHPLSQHHHFALIQALEMRRAAEAPAEKRQAAVERQAEKFVSFWHKTGYKHFREEEEILLPAYARHTRLDEDADVMRMLADHAEIRARGAGFRAAARKEIAIRGRSNGAPRETSPRSRSAGRKRSVSRASKKSSARNNLNAMGRGLTACIPRMTFAILCGMFLESFGWTGFACLP